MNNKAGEKFHAITTIMGQYPVVKLEPDSRDHARYALEQALVDKLINRSEYNELLGYVTNVMFKVL